MRLFLLAVAATMLAAQPRVEGQALKANGDASGALAAFERAAVFEPNAADLRDEIGFLLAVQGRQTQAIPHFEHAIRLNPRYAPAHYHLGVARWLLKDADRAIRAMREAAKIDPLNFEYRFRLATMSYETGDDATALREAKTGGNRADLWNLIGVLQQRKGDLKAARDAYEKAVQLKPTGNEYRNNLGFMLVDLGMAQQGLAQFQRILKRDPEDRLAQINIGYTHLQTGDYDTALAHFQRLVVKYPDQAVIHYDLGLALKQKDQLEAAKKAFREALRLDPEMAEAHYTLGITCWQNGDLDESAEAMRAAIAKRPNYAEAHYMLGTALKQKGELIEAAKALEIAIRLNPETPGPFNTLAQIRQRQGDREAAGKLFAQAAEVKKKLDASQAERLRTMSPSPRPR